MKEFKQKLYKRFWILKEKFYEETDRELRIVLLQSIYTIINEIIDDKYIDKYLKKVNLSDLKAIKFSLYIRHYFVHFPIFSSISDVVIYYDLLSSSKKQSKFLKFLKEEKQDFKFRIAWDNNSILQWEFLLLKNFQPWDSFRLLDVIKVNRNTEYIDWEYKMFYFLFFLEGIMQSYMLDKWYLEDKDFYPFKNLQPTQKTL